MKIATVLFCYNRTKYLQDIIEKVRAIDYVFVDYSDKQQDVINIVAPYTKVLIQRDEHFGLARNIIEGVTEVLEEYDAVIVIEDDLLLETEFIPFMVDGLNKYADAKYIGTISGYYDRSDHCYKASSWGWGTWSRVWEKVNWDYEKVDEGFSSIRSDFPNMYRKAKAGKIDSWAIRFAYHLYKNGLIDFHPQKSLVKHLGDSGANHSFISKFGIRQYLRKFR